MVIVNIYLERVRRFHFGFTNMLMFKSLAVDHTHVSNFSRKLMFYRLIIFHFTLAHYFRKLFSK